ncbi:hypothetical protein C8Q78DRAFT_1083947 [Trametes maxima]|nr:hypothetical protein C8Q78DRAFT_1083947 [Trametes maxima]
MLCNTATVDHRTVYGQYTTRKFNKKLTRFANKPNTYSWVGRERILVEASGPLLDQHLLVESDATFLGDNFLRNIIRPCLNDMSPETAVKSYYDIMEHRADRIENGIHYFDTRGDRAGSVAILADLTLDTLVKTRVAPSSDALRDHAIRIMRILEPLLVHALPLTYGHFCRVFFSLSGDKDRKVRHYAFSILYQQLWRNLALADQYSATGCHDLSALVTFISRVRQDDDLKHFLDACDLVICLATLPSLPLSDYSAIREALQGTLVHLKSFFETPLWHHDPLLFYSLERIAEHLVTLEKKYPQALTDDFLDVLGDVIDKAPQLNVNGDWEDKLKKLQSSFAELRTLRQNARPTPEGRPPFGQRSGPVFPMPDI